MGKFVGGFITAFEGILNECSSICRDDLLGEDGFHTAVRRTSGDVWTIKRNGSSIRRAIETKYQFLLFDGNLEQNMCGSVVDKLEIRLWDIDGCVHSVGFVILNGIGVISALGDFLPRIEGCAEERR